MENQNISRKIIIWSYLHYLFCHAGKRLILKLYAFGFVWKIIVSHSNKHLAEVLYLSMLCVYMVISIISS